MDEDEVSGSYSLRLGDKSKCVDTMKFDNSFGEEELVVASEIRMDGLDCSGGHVKLSENRAGSNSTQFLKKFKNKFDDFLAGNVSSEITCGTQRLRQGEELVFIKPDLDASVQLIDMFGAESFLGEITPSFVFTASDKYVLVGTRCLYGETRLEDRLCFPSAATVHVVGRGARAMRHVVVGDAVHSGGATGMSRVVGWSHRDAHALATFVNVTTAGHGSLVASHGHLVYMRPRHTGAPTLVPMGALKLGMQLVVPRRDEGATSPSVPRWRTVVVQMQVVQMRGMWNPHTSAGDIVVDGFLASCYTSAVSFSTAHALLTPVRAIVSTVVSLFR